MFQPFFKATSRLSVECRNLVTSSFLWEILSSLPVKKWPFKSRLVALSSCAPVHRDSIIILFASMPIISKAPSRSVQRFGLLAASQRCSLKYPDHHYELEAEDLSSGQILLRTSQRCSKPDSSFLDFFPRLSVLFFLQFLHIQKQWLSQNYYLLR